MGNCLKTQLKEVVDNSNLDKLGVLRIQRVYNESDNPDIAYLGINRSVIPDGEVVTLTIVGDGYFTRSYGGASVGKTYEVRKPVLDEPSTLSLWTSNGDYTIEVDNKYAFCLNQSPKDYKVKIDDTFYTSIEIIAGIGYYGNLANVDPTKITFVKFENEQLHTVTYKEEDITRLSLLTHLSLVEAFPEIKMSILGTLIHLTGTMQIACASGSIEQFVAAQRAGGRTTFDGTLNLRWLGAKGLVTFNGSTIPNVEAGNLTWTENTITFRGTTINA